MKDWTCPACGRTFGRNRQSHVCAPAISLDDYYADRPPVQRATADAVIELLEALGSVAVEPVGVGILFKTRTTIAELRPRRDHQALSFGLPRKLVHERVTRTTRAGRGSERYWMGVPVHSPTDIDEQVGEWLAEAFFASLDARP